MNLRRLRGFLGYTIRFVSQCTGVPEGRISAIERELTRPNAVEARVLRRFLEQRIREVLKADGVNRQPGAVGLPPQLLGRGTSRHIERQ